MRNLGGSQSRQDIKAGGIALDPPGKGTLLNASIRRVGPTHFLVVAKDVRVLINVVHVGQVVGGRTDIKDENPVIAGSSELPGVFNLIVGLQGCLIKYVTMVRVVSRQYRLMILGATRGGQERSETQSTAQNKQPEYGTATSSFLVR